MYQKKTKYQNNIVSIVALKLKKCNNQYQHELVISKNPNLNVSLQFLVFTIFRFLSRGLSDLSGKAS